MRGWWVCAVAALAGCDDTVFPGSQTEYTPDWLGAQVLFFDHCVSCHPSVEPGVDLPADVLEDVCEGTGALVVAGDPDASMLYRIMSGETIDGDPAVMPFGTGPLREDQLAPFRQWILDGANVEACP
jgi:hypothetical protein